MNTRKVWAVAAASMLAIGIVGVTTAASVEPIAHSGNITDEGTYKADCPTGFAPLAVAGNASSDSLGGVTVNVTYNDDNTLDFSVVGGTVSVAFVKGGNGYNEYIYPSPVTSDTDLVSPNNGGDQVPAISHSVYCVAEGDEESEAPSTPPQSEPPSAAPESDEPSAPPQSEEPSAPPQSEPPSAAPESDAPSAPPQSEEPSAPPSSAPSGEVDPHIPSTPPSSRPSGEVDPHIPSTEPSSSPSGGVGAETDNPTAPPSDVNGIVGEATATLPLMLIILGVIGLGALVLTPRRIRR